jgi:uncharacterized coiled-coil protein SlyX
MEHDVLPNDHEVRIAKLELGMEFSAKSVDDLKAALAEQRAEFLRIAAEQRAEFRRSMDQQNAEFRRKMAEQKADLLRSLAEHRAATIIAKLY